jgi:invasion protein IalB
MKVPVLRILTVAASLGLVPPLVAGSAMAQAQKPAAGPAQPTPLGQFGDWQAFQLGQTKGRSCFAISNPKERKPAGLNRDPATFFVTHRPGEGVKNEISLIVGFPMKDGSDASIKIGKSAYSLYTKEANAWVKNAAEEGTVISVMKKGKDLVFEGVSRRGNKTSDRYSLAGLSQALDAIAKACP